jgi:CHAT domain-containing protein/tetratricopeptide (TPR) repeat protein
MSRTRVLGVMAGAVLLACRETRRPPEVTAVPAHFAVAESLRVRGQSSEALPRFRALRDSLARTPDTAGLWRAQMGIADALMRLGQADSAWAAYNEAMGLTQNDPTREGRTLTARSFFLAQRSRLDEAMADALRARDLARASGDRALLAITHRAVGRVYSLLGRSREALEEHRQEVALHEGGDPVAYALALGEMGIDLRRLGRLTEAVEVYEQALETYRQTQNPEGIARTSYNLGNVYVANGDLPSAERLFETALPYAEQLRDMRGQAFIHAGLGQVYVLSGNRARARMHYERARDFAQRARVPDTEILASNALAGIELAEGRLALADAILDSTLARVQVNPAFLRRRGAVRINQAVLAIMRGDLDAARARVADAGAIADTLREPDFDFEVLRARAQLGEAERRADASEQYERAIAFLESWRGRIALGDLRMTVAELRLDVYEGAIRTHLAAGRHAAAFGIAERARARLLLEVMAERFRSPTVRGTGRSDSLRVRIREASALRAAGPPASRAALDTLLERLGDSLEVAEGAERVSTSDVGDAAPLEASAVRDRLLNPTRALLAYFWGDSAVYGWLVTRDGVRASRLGAADSLAALVDFLRQTIDRPSDADWTIPARRAYRTFVEPLGSIPQDELLIVADGPLSYVPLEVFIVADSARPWATSKSFVYGPSASVLAKLAARREQSGWAKQMLAVGNPASARARGEEVRASEDTALAVLPFAIDEVREIGRLFRGSADVLLGSRATAQRWHAMRPTRYRYLHFAAHARVNDRHPDETHVALADGRLDLPTIRRLHLTAELVTISACETALGPRVRGEGVIGLPHAFLSAGARSTLVTLWRVADRSTSEFMTDFYRAMSGGQGSAASLRAVRRKWAAVRHPAYWAPFVLVGGVE